jgi:putative addiction module component (TIGR02574 family)
MSLDEIKKLDVKERIILMNEIWSTLEEDDMKIESPSWHKEVLDNRLEKLDNNEANFITLEELKA